MTHIFPTGGVNSHGPFTQPAIPPVQAGCVKFMGDNCQTGLEDAMFDSLFKELLNITDEAGNAFDCSKLTNIKEAICAIAERKACQEITDRQFCQAINGNNNGAGSITLPAGLSYDVQGFLWAGSDTLGMINSNGWIGGEIDNDDDSYFAFICGNYPGGQTFTASDINPTVSDNVRGYSMMIRATRIGDC